jgi:tetratricopeptide (TPR) repeat protein
LNLSPNSFPLGGRVGFGVALGLAVVAFFGGCYATWTKFKAWRLGRQAASQSLPGDDGSDGGDGADPGLIFEDPGMLPPIPPLPSGEQVEKAAASAAAAVTSQAGGESATPIAILEAISSPGSVAPANVSFPGTGGATPSELIGEDLQAPSGMSHPGQAEVQLFPEMAVSAPPSDGLDSMELFPGLTPGQSGEAVSPDLDPHGPEEDQADQLFLAEMEAKLAEDPNNLEALEWMAYMQFKQGEVNQAIHTYLKLINIIPAKPDYRFYLAQSYQKAGYLAEAQQTYEQILLLAPPPAMEAQVRTRLEGVSEGASAEGQVEIEVFGTEEMPSASRAEVGGAEDIGTGGDQGEISEVLTQYTAGDGSGTEELEEKLSRDPGNVQLLDWLAFMYYSNNDIEKARDAYQRLIDLDGENQSAYYYLGNTHFKLDHVSEAFGCWEELLFLFPKGRFARKTRRRLKEVKSRLKAEGKEIPVVPTPGQAAAAPAPQPDAEAPVLVPSSAPEPASPSVAVGASAPLPLADTPQSVGVEVSITAPVQAMAPPPVFHPQPAVPVQPTAPEFVFQPLVGEASVASAPAPAPAQPVVVEETPAAHDLLATNDLLLEDLHELASRVLDEPMEGGLNIQVEAVTEAPKAPRLDADRILKSGSISELEALFLQDPSSIRVHRKLARAYLKAGDMEAAVEAFQDLAASVEGPGPLYDVGRALLAAGQATEAVERFEELLERYPESKEAGNALQLLVKARSAQRKQRPSAPSKSYQGLDDLVAAETAVGTPAPKLPPELTGDPDPAPAPAPAPAPTPVFAEAGTPAAAPPSSLGVNMTPVIGEERFNALMSTFLTEDRDRWVRFAGKVGGLSKAVLQNVEKLLSKEPENTQAREFLAYLYLSMGRSAAAVKVFKSLVDRRPGDARYTLYQGNALLAAGNANEAVGCWREAQAMDPEASPGMMAAFLLKTLKV